MSGTDKLVVTIRNHFFYRDYKRVQTLVRIDNGYPHDMLLEWLRTAYLLYAFKRLTIALPTF